MEVSFRQNDLGLIITVRDWGHEFDIDRVRVPDVTAPLEERELGGLGLFFMRQLMDSLEYRPDPELGNELVMVKRLRRHE
jgi:serine/threonine-protein kinase RsbW